MSFPAYPIYKDSGAEWLGQVPNHWKLVRLKNVLASKVSDGPHTTPEFLDEGIPFLSVDGIQDGNLIFEGCRYVSEDAHREYSKKTAPRRDDLLMGKAASTGKIARVKVDFEFSIWSPLALIRPNVEQVVPTFLENVLKSPRVQAGIDVLCTSNTQKNISMDDIPRLSFPLPPIDEQIHIGRFLDHETAKIDALIQEQERLIGLLDEDRSASVANLLLGGRYSKKKASGIEWIGNIPEHWHVARVCNMFTESTELGGDGLPVLSVSIHDGVSDKELNDDELDRKVTRSEDRGKYKRVRSGDLVYNMMRAWQGGFGSVEVDGLVSPAYVVARPSCNISTKYVESVLRTCNAIVEMKSRSRGITDFRLRLYWEEFRDVRIPVPPLSEQVEILEQINSMDERVFLLKAEATKLIALLTERRLALISSAVTGKIDVRGLNV